MYSIMESTDQMDILVKIQSALEDRINEIQFDFRNQIGLLISEINTIKLENELLKSTCEKMSIQINELEQKKLENNVEMIPCYKRLSLPQLDFKKCPSVVPYSEFNPVSDAQALRKAMKGFGTDEDTLIDIITHRTNEQRQEIQKCYKTHFGRDLIEDIKSETSGNFENLLVALLIPTSVYYIEKIHRAMAGIGTDEEILVEFLCGLTNHEIQVINYLYQERYKTTLEKDIVGDTSGHFKRLLVALSVGGRDENVPVNYELARRDAAELLKAGELRMGTDESTFNQILCRRSYEQLKVTNEEYRQMTGKTLISAIEHEFSGWIKDGLLAILNSAIDRHEYFASRLHKSMAGIGTNDDQLIRIIVTRSEIDLINIKTAFEQKYGKSLRSWIKGDTSGHYKHCLYSLIGEKRSVS